MHHEKVEALFGESLGWIEERGLYKTYSQAIGRVVEYYDLDLSPERIHTLVATLGIHRIPSEEIVEASHALMSSEEFRQTVRYGGTLQAQDFRNALRPDMDPGEAARRGELGDGSRSAQAFVRGEDGLSPYERSRQRALERQAREEGREISAHAGRLS